MSQNLQAWFLGIEVMHVLLFILAFSVSVLAFISSSLLFFMHELNLNMKQIGQIAFYSKYIYQTKHTF